MTEKVLVDVDQMKKTYRGYELNCSLQIREGHVTGLIGQNGAGKSTTFKAILGLIKLDGGKITVFGQDAEKLSVADKNRIGVVFAEAGFSNFLKVKDIVPIMQVLYKEFNKNEFLNKCDRFQIPLDKKIKNFSTGMKAKLKLLVAISHDADLLVLDEPTAGLDVIARDEILEMLRDYMDVNPHKAILISSHISSDLETLCDDLYMIHDGSIILHEDTDVLLGEYAILKVDEDQMRNIDTRALLKTKKESFGYKCLTNDRSFYMDNYPDVVVEKSTIDDLIYMMIRGE